MSYLQSVQKDLKKMGLQSVIAPCSFPQGNTMSLMIGESEESVVAASTAQEIGAEYAHTSDKAKSAHFSSELANNIAQRAINNAAMNLFAVFSAATNGLLWIGHAASVEDAICSLNRVHPFANTEPSDEDEFLFAVNVSPEEAAKIEALTFGAPIPELQNEATEITYAQALNIVIRNQ
ncbi:hypothetical protein V8Z74_14575 [Comamonas sp. w2-DMI]